MADSDSALEAQITALYGLPLPVFIARRNQLAQQLRRAGERDLADQVKNLRKPSVAAWTLNQLRHRQPELVEALLEAGRQLHAAQERLLGQGERGALREATVRERERVQATVDAAETVLHDAGLAVTPPLHNKLWETAHAAAIDPELGKMLRSGRLSEDRQLGDLGLAGLGWDPAVKPAPGRGSSSRARASTSAASGQGPILESQRRLEQARQRKQSLEAKHQTMLQLAGNAERALAHAQTVLRNAEAQAARALADVERAQADAARALAAAEQARKLMAEAADQLNALKTAQ